MSGLKRITREIANCNDDKTSKIGIELVDESPFHLKGSFPGPEGTPYEGGHFEVDIVVPDDYPLEPFKIKFLTNVYHPNICYGSGVICLDTLMTQWSPVLSLRTTLIMLQSYLGSPDPDDPLNAEVAKQYVTNKDRFNYMAAYWTQIHAGGPGPGGPLTSETLEEDPEGPNPGGERNKVKVMDYLRRLFK